MPFYADWLAHTTADDPYWTARDHSAGVADVTAPVQLVGGWSDIFLPWMLEDFVALQGAGRSPQLVVGPWAHTSPELARVSAREGIAWLRAHLLDDHRLVDSAPVRIWLAGAREWLSMDSWPPPAQARVLHARAGGQLPRLSHRDLTRAAAPTPTTQPTRRRRWAGRRCWRASRSPTIAS